MTDEKKSYTRKQLVGAGAVGAAILAALGLATSSVVVSTTQPTEKAQVVTTVTSSFVQQSVCWPSPTTARVDASCLMVKVYDPPAPSLSDRGSQIKMNSCGKVYSVDAKLGGSLTVINDGTDAMSVVGEASMPPTPGAANQIPWRTGSILPNQWFTFNWDSSIPTGMGYQLFVQRADSNCASSRINVKVS